VRQHVHRIVDVLLSKHYTLCLFGTSRHLPDFCNDVWGHLI
jgi:hypothetical protein